MYLRAAAKVRKAAERDETREIGGAKCVKGQFFFSFHGLNRSSVGDAWLLEVVAIEMVRHRAYHPGNQRNIDLIRVCYGKASHRPTSMCSFNRHFQKLWLLQKPGSCLNT